MSFHSFICCPFLFRIVARPYVNLIHGASRAVVLSDVGASATKRAGMLSLTFSRSGPSDRDPLRAMQPVQSCPSCKTFSPPFIFAGAQLFTARLGRTGPLLPRFTRG